MEREEQFSTLAYTVSETAKKVNEIHAALFGIEGQGGLHSWVRDHDKEIKKLNEHKNKSIGAVSMLTIIAGIAGGLISKLFK